MWGKKLLLLFMLIGLASSTFAGSLTTKVDSDWGNGFCYKFYITGPSQDWKINFDLSTQDQITSKRNGNFSCSDGKCVITPVDWNKTIEDGKEVEIGFCANGSEKPANVSFEETNSEEEVNSSEDESSSTDETVSSDENTQTDTDQTTEDNVTENESENTLQNLQEYNLEKNGLKVDVKVQSKRQDGYCRQIVVENTNTDKKVIDWQLSFEFANKLSSSWSANFTQSNGKYTITPKDWNQTLNPGDKTTVGFCVDSTTADSNWNIDGANVDEISTNTETTTEENNTTTEYTTQPEDNTTDTSEPTNENTTNTNENTTDVNWTIQAQGDEVASYPESQWPTYKVDDKFYLEINPWNITYPADGYAKMYYDASNGVVTYIQDLKNIKIQNAGGYVLGYPEVYVGNKPWNGNYVDAGSNLPAKISDLKSVEVKAIWKYEHPTDLSCNFAMEGWFTKTKDQSTGVGAGEVEMMIMWYRNIQNAAGSKVGEVTIPVEVNGETKDITFDIYKANIGWDFVTFIPHNYQDFQNASVKFDAMDFVKATSKYVPQINGLYFEDWEFGTEFGTPTTTQAALRWQVSEFKVTGVLNTQGSTETTTTAEDSTENNIEETSAYQIKPENTDKYSAQDYYQVSSQSNNDYDKLIPDTYKSQIDSFFESLASKYSSEALKSIYQNIIDKVDSLLSQYQSNQTIAAILLYIKNKAQTALDNLSLNTDEDTQIVSDTSNPYYFASGTDIYVKDANGNIKELKLFGVNWFGFETPNYVVHGLWSRNYVDMLKQIKSLGFNAIRMPFCSKIIDNPTPTGIDFYKNPDLEGLGSLDIMKKIISEANKLGIYVLLDYHRIGCNYIEPLRYTDTFTETDYINVWKKMAEIFKNYPNVIGADLKNEPHSEGQGDSLYTNGSTWGYNSKTDWNLAAARIGKAILSVAPNWLIFVEGTQVTNPDIDKSYKRGMNAWWGGNLMAVAKYPVDLPREKLVYSPHVYGPSVYEQPYFDEADFPNNMPDIWYHHFGYVKSDLHYPVIPGEFGGKYEDKDKIWQQAFVDWMIKNHYCSFFFWSWNPNSGDTGGILQDDWISINVDKYENLKRLMDACSAN